MAIDANLKEQVKSTLVAGRYQLLLGAGASRDSRDRQGRFLPMSDELRRSIVSLTDLKQNSSLSRAYAVLTEAQVDSMLTQALSKCDPGKTVRMLTQFYWSRIYTLNIDDALEGAYSNASAKQQIAVVTHKDLYSAFDDPQLLPIIHVHGYVGRASDGYIFSLADYAQSMGPGNPWISVLSQTIATEPFIIAGTNLEEPDLEYFLAGRKNTTVRTERGPSFLVEPDPDAATERECQRHGLNLYKGTLDQFLSELEGICPTRPAPYVVPTNLNSSLLKKEISTRELALFSRDFAYIRASKVQEDADLGFYVGREPSFSDIALNRDIPRDATARVKLQIQQMITDKDKEFHFLLLDDNAGSGKTTIVMRALYELAAEGLHVFQYNSNTSLDIAIAKRVFDNFKHPFVIFCDNLADHATVISELYHSIDSSEFLVVGAERSYRMNYVVQNLGGIGHKSISLPAFSRLEARSLIERMNSHGLTSEKYEPGKLEAYARDITTDCIAIAVCRIMNDFRPAEKIVESLIQDSNEAALDRYLAVALAAHCYKAGLSQQILVSGFDATGFKEQFLRQEILPLAYSDRERRDYVVPLNPVIAQRILRETVKRRPDTMFNVYRTLGAYIAPYINRGAIKRRTPEARLAGRLFDYDEIVSQMLPIDAERFYLEMRKHWSWNSRYWEQLALLKLDQSKHNANERAGLISQAVTHARHAVQVERHPLPLTTLGKILIEDMKHSSGRFERAFEEAFNYLEEAVNLEGSMNRIAIHPYMTLFSGIRHYISNGGTLSKQQRTRGKKLVENADKLFPKDPDVQIQLANIRSQFV